MSEIRNQLKNQSFEAVVPSSFGVVGGRVFPDEPSVNDQMVLAQIVKTWQAAHNPTYGTPIGGSGEVSSGDGAGAQALVTVLSAVQSEVYRVQAISCNNKGLDPMIISIFAGGVPIVVEAGAQPGNLPVETATGAPLSLPLFVDVNTPLTYQVLSGTATDATLNVLSIKVSQ